MSQNLVVVPTYNEIENIHNIVEAVMNLASGFHLLIVDDNSPDGTADAVKELQKRFPERLFVLQRGGKLGLGTAYIAAFKWALQRNYETVSEMDADFSHNPKDLEKLLAAVQNGADLAIGSRYKSGVNVVNWPMGRVLMSYFASIYVQLITGMKINDTTAGFKCYRRAVLETINLDKIISKGYAFQIEMKFKAWLYKFNIQEIPIVFTDRTKGTSKMSGGIFNEAVLGVLKMKFSSLFQSYKR